MTPIIFNTRDELVKVDLDKMIYAVADDNYVTIYFRNGQHAMICTTLQSLERLILTAMTGDKSGTYTRIGRRYIVNNNYITHINIPKMQLVLSDLDVIKPITLTVAKEALKALKQSMTERSDK